MIYFKTPSGKIEILWTDVINLVAINKHLIIYTAIWSFYISLDKFEKKFLNQVVKLLQEKASLTLVNQNIRLVNDSRSPELRKSEIVETINNLIKSSAKVKGIEISYGEGFLEPIKLNDESLELLEDRGKSDTSYINIFVKVAFNKKEEAKRQIENLRKFIETAKLEGRTLIEEKGDVGLSIIKPQQYRYEIIRAISEENKKMKELVGEDCEVSVKGLEGRVFWERVSVGELMLYIGYSTTIKCK